VYSKSDVGPVPTDREATNVHAHRSFVVTKLKMDRLVLEFNQFINFGVLNPVQGEHDPPNETRSPYQLFKSACPINWGGIRDAYNGYH